MPIQDVKIVFVLLWKDRKDRIACLLRRCNRCANSLTTALFRAVYKTDIILFSWSPKLYFKVPKMTSYVVGLV